ncbi:alpha/beta hydrolase [Neobacillus cucumis]|uniref:alpha/beta hydrolase n=1 Tax=Neobacillus cucumis TaxID=1740721 RepID=UPI002E1D49BB|nr:alpha/beta fold hydrolase [Neobacillus cucumis]
MVERFSVLSGAEAFFLKGNEIGILISHGFGGTPQSVRFLGEYISSHGYTVYAPRLKGHGTHYTDMDNCSYHDWIETLEDGFRFLRNHCEIIYVIGQSMGGTLTINLADKFPEIKGIVLINAAMTTIPIMEQLIDKREHRYIDEGSPDIKDKRVFEITYTKTPLDSIHQLLALMKETCGKIKEVTCPTLAFQSVEDHVVPPENTDYIITHLQSDIKRVIPLYNSYHVASMDFEKRFIAEQCCLFFEELSSKENKKRVF